MLPVTQQPSTPSQQVSESNPLLNLLAGVLDNLEEFYIHKSVGSARVALNASNNQIFAYSEEVLMTSPSVRVVISHHSPDHHSHHHQQITSAGMSFTDNNGERFMHVVADAAGAKLFSGSTYLGMIQSPDEGEFLGASALGLGSVQFNGDTSALTAKRQKLKGMVVCPICYFVCCLFCCCPSAKTARFDIIIGGQVSGEFSFEQGGPCGTKFNSGIDARVKAIAVVMSFMAFNELTQ